MRKTLLLLLLSAASSVCYGQTDSLMDNMFGDNNSKPAKDFVTSTFKATRIINGSSVEQLASGVLDFRISHRFGRVDEGTENFFGLDNATTRIGVDYGINHRIMVGLGHNTLNKEDDGFLKVKILRQQKRKVPITISYAGSISVQTTKAPTLPAYDSNKWHFSNRLYFANQILIARKFNEKFSLQLMPTFVHYNLVDSSKFDNNTIAIGIGGRIKISKRVAITGEYYYRVTNADLLYNGQKTFNSLSIGVDIETGGHVFQMMLTNSQGMSDRTFVGQTTENWEKSQIHFGFNISRVFTVVKPKEFRTSGNSW